MSLKFHLLDKEDVNLFKDGFIAAEKLFNCSISEKQKIKIPKLYHRGWEKIHKQSETFLYGIDSDIKNLWPKKLESKYIKSLEILFEKFFELGKLELRKINCLDFNTIKFDNPRIKISKYFNHRIGEMVCGEHFDYGLLTLNMSNVNNDLEFKSASSWEYMSNSNKLGYIVFSGKQLEDLSNRKIEAVTHRVINKSNIERISFSLFLDMIE